MTEESAIRLKFATPAASKALSKADSSVRPLPVPVRTEMSGPAGVGPGRVTLGSSTCESLMSSCGAVEEAHQSLAELLGADAGPGQEDRAAQCEVGTTLGCDVVGAVDQQGRVGQGVLASQVGHDPGPVVEALEVEDDRPRAQLPAAGDGLRGGRGVHDVESLVGEQLREHARQVPVPADEQDRSRQGAARTVAGRHGAGYRRGGESEQDGGPGPELALRPDPTPVPLHDAPADGQAEAGPALLAGVGGVHLLEALEDGLELVGRDATAAV